MNIFYVESPYRRRRIVICIARSDRMAQPDFPLALSLLTSSTKTYRSAQRNGACPRCSGQWNGPDAGARDDHVALFQPSSLRCGVS